MSICKSEFRNYFFPNLAGTLCSTNCVLRISWELINSNVVSSSRLFLFLWLGRIFLECDTTSLEGLRTIVSYLIFVLGRNDFLPQYLTCIEWLPISPPALELCANKLMLHPKPDLQKSWMCWLGLACALAWSFLASSFQLSLFTASSGLQSVSWCSTGAPHKTGWFKLQEPSCVQLTAVPACPWQGSLLIKEQLG